MTKTKLKAMTVGQKKGIRIPLKKFIAVPSTKDPPTDFPLYFKNEWQNDDLHYVIMGGAEHQQQLTDFLLYLKENDSTNLDIYENCFNTDDIIRLTSENFVSALCYGDWESRQERESFFLLSRQVPSKQEDPEDPGRQDSSGPEPPKRWIHAICGFSAKASKVGFLYWLDKYLNDDQAGFSENIQWITYHTNQQEIGDLYTETSWFTNNRLRIIEMDYKNRELGKTIIKLNETSIGLTLDKDDDFAFYYIIDAKHNVKDDLWIIQTALRSTKKDEENTPSTIGKIQKRYQKGIQAGLDNYEVPMLLSVGVILWIDDKLLLRKRSDESGWSHLCGFADNPGGLALTAKRYFYGQVLIHRSNNKNIPVGFQFDDGDEYFLETIYRRTWNRMRPDCGNVDFEQIEQLRCMVHDFYRPHSSPVRISHGGTTRQDNYFICMNEKRNTLELAFVYQVNGGDMLEFEPGETNMELKRFNLKELEDMKKDELDPIIVKIRDIVISARKEAATTIENGAKEDE